MHKSILIFIDWFDPGYKAGGPIRSAVNLVRHLQHHYKMFIFTSDRDLGSSVPYSDVRRDEWICYDEQVQVFYCSPDNLNRRYIREIIQNINPDHLYLNSLFSKYFTIYPLLINKCAGWKNNTILAPRGMLRDSALKYKSLKKKLYLRAFRWMAVHRHITFQATDDTEFKDVKRIFGQEVRVLQIPNFPAYVQAYPGSLPKRKGELRIVFVGRLHPIKNLHFLLERLPALQGKVVLTVIGSEEDGTYVEQCRTYTANLPDNITVLFEGEKPNHELPAIIAQHHIFSLPTQGENFGHAIFEGLIAGRPVLISDQTPWRELSAAEAGWDISLSNTKEFEKTLQEILDMEQRDFDAWSLGAWKYAEVFSNSSNALSKYTTLFQ